MTTMATSPSAPAVPSPRVLLRGLAFDVGLPIATYYVLHLLGASDWPALLAASGVAAARIVRSAVRQRSFNAFATVMLLVHGGGVAPAFATGDPRTLLLRTRWSPPRSALWIATFVGLMVWNGWYVRPAQKRRAAGRPEPGTAGGTPA
ncbi:hypothetical protein ACQP04_34905 [Pseudonocardia halophobica]|uniref:hypothetical protein n=1 Tax=Pseudonocardia halophobica TaxID=29401 RepID=UPI003D8F5D86